MPTAFEADKFTAWANKLKQKDKESLLEQMRAAKSVEIEYGIGE